MVAKINGCDMEQNYVTVTLCTVAKTVGVETRACEQLAQSRRYAAAHRLGVELATS